MASRRIYQIWLVVGVLLSCLASPMVHAEEIKKLEEAEDIKKLAQQVQNPVSDLVRVGFLNGTLFGSGVNDHVLNIFNLETSNTRKIGDWAFLTRLNIPFPYLPASAIPNKAGSLTGLGDISFTSFVARDESKRWFKGIGGFGPTFVFNSATDERLGLGKWSAGPILVLVKQPNPWVVGVLLSNLWSFAGDSDRRKVNRFLVQPILNYNFRNGWYLTSTPGITANWKAEDVRNRWTLPVGGGVGKVLGRGERQPINIRLQGFYFLEKPDRAPDWTLQLKFEILFPDKPDTDD